MKRKALVVGGNSGIGLSIAINFLDKDYEQIYIVGKDEPRILDIPENYRENFAKKIVFYKLNLCNQNLEIFDTIEDFDTLVITCGFGRVATFENLEEREIINLIKVNEISVIRIIKKYYHKIVDNKDFYTLVLGSIAGHISSPLFSVYGASKRAVCGFIENINAELIATGKRNRILDVSPGSIKFTQFSGGNNQVACLLPVTNVMLDMAYKREILFIPEYENVYKEVIKRYQENPIQYGVESYHYKIQQNRLSKKPQVIVGYLSGTFDLFHVGHLNLLKRAKNECDYLIVGLHKDGAWKGKETFIPFEERMEILKACKYVDEVINSFPEDTDAYVAFGIHKLFVGSDYKGSARFEKYEEYFKDKEVEIVYFPYTTGVSSSFLREKLKNKG